MRKISTKLIQRLTEGDLIPLLNYIKTDNELRLEVRPKGEAFVYYRKCKALEIGNLKVDKKYGNVPSTNLAIENPLLYFEQIKHTIDIWLTNNKKRGEFDTQQKVAKCNQNEDDKYIIIDMEYAFDRSKVHPSVREKVAVFDLLGIERKTNKIVLFEVKKGMKSTRGNSGINSHINDYNTYIHGRHDNIYRNILYQDVKNIISDKIKLGLITNFDVPIGISKHEPELVFIFQPDHEVEVFEFESILEGRHKLIVVSDNDFKLR